MADEILCIIEIPKGSRNKYEWDEKRGLLPFDRFLSSSTVSRPITGSWRNRSGPDGEDPLDVLVAVSEPTFPGCGVIARPVAVMELEDRRTPPGVYGLAARSRSTVPRIPLTNAGASAPQNSLAVWTASSIAPSAGIARSRGTSSG